MVDCSVVLFGNVDCKKDIICCILDSVSGSLPFRLRFDDVVVVVVVVVEDDDDDVGDKLARY